jgi:urease accessory protein
LNIGREGTLRLVFAQRACKTALVESYSRPPLQVMRAIPDAANCLCVYMLSPTGGVVQNDRYHVDICAGEATHTLVTTQSATKVYRMPDGRAEQVIRIEVERDAVFEYVPDAAILFSDSDFHQRIEISLEPGALALVFEIILPGRTARGEHLRFRRYVNQLVVRDTNGLLLYDAADIQPAKVDLNTLTRLEGYTCWGSAYLLGDLNERKLDAVAFCETHHLLMQGEGFTGSLSPLYRNGISARILSYRLENIYYAFHTLRAIIRTQFLKLPDVSLRK